MLLCKVTVKGLTTPLLCLLRGSCLFVQVLGDLRVTSYWIDTLVLKNWGKYLRYFAASPFPLQGKTNACSRGSKKDFWRYCRGGSRQVKSRFDLPPTCGFLAPLPWISTHKSRHTKYPSQTLLPRITLFAICLSFSSPPLHPCRFIRLFSARLFFVRLFLLASCLLVCWIVSHDGSR